VIYLAEPEVLLLHRRIVETSGGSPGVRDRGALEASLAQPFQTFGGQELYPTFEDKAAALCFFLVSNHPFVDGNKRIGHAAMEVVLVLNGAEISAPFDEQEAIILRLASGNMDREEFSDWVRRHVVPRS
jgi:death on curing protein